MYHQSMECSGSVCSSLAHSLSSKSSHSRECNPHVLVTPEHQYSLHLPTTSSISVIQSGQNELHNFSAQLKNTYTQKNFFKGAVGPDFGKIQYINLALIKKQGVNEGDKARDKFLRDSLHGLVDDIIKKKIEIDISDIFNYGSDPRKLVLIEGSPGVGKTMLSLKLCQDWALEKTFLAEYDLVILVTLRRFQSKTSLQLQDLISTYCDEGDFTRDISQALIKRGGEKTLIILEGWDELSPELRQDMSFFHDLITGNKLSEASILVTSRPTVTDSLYRYMDERRIEVLGFQSNQINDFVKLNVPEKASLILTHLERFPNLRALAHIPLTLSIICRVIKVDEILPSTLTELYDKYVCESLFRTSKKKSFCSLTVLKSIDELPNEELKEIVKQLGNLALNGLTDKRYIFTSSNFNDKSKITKSCFDGYGLLTCTIVPVTSGHDRLYQFVHLSVQEFLAAYQIRQLPADERIALLREYRDDKQFQNVWKFYSGITKLKDKEIQDAIVHETTQGNRSQLFLIHCLYEAHNSEICSIAASKLEWKLNLHNMSLNTTDCLCAAYVVSSAGGQWSVDLKGCNIGAIGLDIFKQHMISSEDDEAGFSIKDFNLMHNHILPEACQHLAEMLKHLTGLRLDSNKIGDEGTEVLCKALSKNETVTSIHFAKCGLGFQSGRNLAMMLEENHALKDLYVGFEALGDDGLIPLAQALTLNQTLTELTMTNTGMTIKGLKQFRETLIDNKTLKIVRFDRNNFGLPECEVIAEIISCNESLELIDVSKNSIGDAGFGLLIDALTAKPRGLLENLRVFGCNITFKGVSKLVKLFQVTETLQIIQLGCNALEDKGAEYIGKAVIANTSNSVRHLLLENTSISSPAKDKLERIRKNIDRQPGQELDITYINHAQLLKLKR